MNRLRRLVRAQWGARPAAPASRRGCGRFVLLLAVVGGGLLVANGVGCGGSSDGPPPAPELPGVPAPPAPPEPPEPPPDGAAGPERVYREFYEVAEGRAERLRADLELALGQVSTAPAERGALFQADVTLAGSQLRPQFDVQEGAAETRVSLGLGGESVSLRGVRRGEQNRWRLFFSERVPLDLHFELGAAEADLDLTGLSVERLALEAGLGETRLHFGAPNAVAMERLQVHAGLGDLAATGLGNARARHVTFDGGAGTFALDFRGAAPAPGARADIHVGMATLTVVLPRGVPLFLSAPSSFMTQVSVPAGLVVRGDGAWATPDADDHPDAFRVAITAGPGKVNVRLAD